MGKGTLKDIKDNLHKDVRGFAEELQTRFPDIEFTSGLRVGAKTKKGGESRHAHGEALDFRINPKIGSFLESDEGVQLLHKYQLGFLDESKKENKMWGNAMHIGKDSKPLSITNQKYSNIISKQTSTPNVNYLETSPQNTTFTEQADVEDKVNKNIEEVNSQTKEYNFLDELQKIKEEDYAYLQQKRQPQQETQPQIDYNKQYEQISRFVDTPIVAQQGGKVDMYGSPITAREKRVVGKDRTEYNPRTNTMEIGDDYDGWVKDDGLQEDLRAHENYHAKQHQEGRDNYDIAYNTTDRLWAEMQKRPEITSTSNVFYKFHNRKDREVDDYVNSLADRIPENQFFRDAFYDLAFDKKIDNEIYSNPETLEGEADFYAKTGLEFNKLQQGGKKDLDVEWLKNWYSNRVIPNPELQKEYLKIKPEYIRNLENAPPPTYVENGSLGEGVEGQYRGGKDAFLKVTKGSLNSTKLHEYTHAATNTGGDSVYEGDIYDVINQQATPKKDVTNKWVKENYNYATDPDEVTGRLQVLRRDYNFKPDEVITPERIKEIRTKRNDADPNVKNLLDIYGDENLAKVLNSVAMQNNRADKNYAQQGGVYSPNELAFLSEIAVKDNNGYWNKDNHGKVVQIDGGEITMKNIHQKLIGVSKETGEKKIMMPGKNYTFKNTKNVIEIPVTK
jgi:hypothetical protein